MKLTKQQEKEIMQVYNTWWESYLNGDLKTYDSYLDDDFRFVGSTGEEEFLNKKETSAFFEATADQFAGKAKLSNIIRTIEPMEGMVLITDLADTHILSGTEWVYYARFRFTSLLRKTKNGWRFFYQHFSTPDLKAQEGETLGLEKITTENLELRDAIKRRTAELEHKNRDLEIEAALERVRARTMAMHKSHELGDVATLLFKELNELVENLWTCGFVLCERDRNEDEWWLSTGEGFISAFYLPNTGDVTHHNIYNGWKDGESYHTEQLEGPALQEHYDWLMTIPFTKRFFDDMLASGLELPTWQKLHCAYFSYGYLVMITKVPCPEEEIFKRFALVFDQTYTRFLELQKAELQSKEAQIELGLERVRARAMAMQRSDELRDTALLLFQQVEALGIKSFACGFNIWDDDKKAATAWMASEDRLQPPFKTTTSEDVYLPIYEAEQRGESLFILEQAGKELEAHYEYLITIPEVKEMAETGLTLPSFQVVHCAYFSKGYLMFITFEHVSDAHDIFKRFAKVFDQAYTRFFDLQKAEEQAREAEIELALERVRSRTMAMQHSDELREVVRVIYEQLEALNIEAKACNIIIMEKSGGMQYWVSGFKQDIYPESYHVPYLNHPYLNAQLDAWKRKDKYAVFEYLGKEKKSFDKLFFSQTEFRNVPEEAQKIMKSLKLIKLSTAYFNYGALQVIGPEPITQENAKTLQRMAKVFEQTYTRFLDLQKAEVQTRKAQIEIALERTRTQSMLMQHSDDLNEVSKVFHEQLLELGIPSEFSFVWLPNEENKDHMFWAAWSENKGGSASIKSKAITYDLDKSEPYTAACFTAWKSDEQVHISHIPAGEIHAFFATWKELLRGAKKLKPRFFPEGIYYAEAYMKYGCFGINIRRELNIEEQQILERFSTEFERTYTRFLHLQKAETQAREAKIEAALEKVRSRTMAMQHSGELPEAANVLFLEIQALGIPAWSAGYCIWEVDKKSASCNMSTEGIIQKEFSLPSIGVGYNFYKPLKNEETFYVAELGGKELVKHYEFMRTLSTVGETLEGFINQGISLPTFQIFHIAYFSKGYLMFITYESVPNEWDVFKRFGKVFEQTYTRFLDLQKAEEQAREAQIESALEKVRSRSLAMHKTDELQEVVAVVAEKLQKLGVIFDAGGVILCTYFPDNKDVVHWIAAPDFSYSGNYLVPYFDNPIFNDAWDSKIRGDAYFSKEFPVEVKNNFFSHCFEHSDYKSFPDEFKQHALQAEKHHLSAAWSKNSAIIIPSLTGVVPSESDAEIMKRFSKVFEQAYIRFLDLQKAEEQTRTAQINLAVERVRAKALAMHKSEEIMEVVAKLKDEVMNLEIPDVIAATIFLNEGDDKVRMWDLSSIQKLEVGYQVALDITFKLKKTDPYLYVKRVWENQKNYFVEIQDVKGFKRIIAWLREHNQNKVADEVEEFIETTKLERLYHATKKLNNGKLCIDLLNPPSDEMESILTKMGAAFDLAYKRFEDLQKAEKQAREVQVEASLERIRSHVTAMKASADLLDIVVTMRSEFVKLGHVAHYFWHMRWLPDTYEKAMTSGDGTRIGNVMELPRGFHENAAMTKWENNKVPVAVFPYDAEGAVDYVDKMIRLGNFQEIDHNTPGPDDIRAIGGITFIMARTTHGEIGYSLPGVVRNPPVEDLDILVRFATAFDLAHKRFEDLRQSEIQASETQIELSLERVRSKTMAMHNSKDVGETVLTLFNEVLKLGLDKSIRCGIGILEGNESMETWSANFLPNGEVDLSMGMLNMTIHPLLIQVKEAWKKDETNFAYKLIGKDVTSYYNALNDEPDYPFNADLDTLPEKVYHNSFFFSEGVLFAFASNPISEEAVKVLKRFTAVFEQTYTRFLDLQKAEKQAREAQIETSLERVRSSTMAMHKSEDLLVSANLLYTEFKTLGFTQYFTCGFVIIDEESSLQHVWVTDMDGEIFESFQLPLTGDPVFQVRYEKWRQKVPVFYQKVGGAKLKKHLSFAIPHFGSEEAENMVANQFPDPTYFYMANFSHGYLHIVGDTKLADEEEELLTRFTRVFEQTYTRFLDLKKAEEQAREAQIEASLERVRSKAMAMHNSKDLITTANQLFNEFQYLDISFIRCGVLKINENRTAEVYSFSHTKEKKAVAVFGTLKLIGHELVEAVFQHWKLQKEHVHELKGEALKRYYKLLNKQIKIPKLQLEKSHFGHAFYFPEGCLYCFTNEKMSDDTLRILRKFNTVMGLTYRRYFELQEAEARELAAIKESSLDRVRAEIASMRTADDLNRITPLVWKELTILGVPFFRCGVFIIDSEIQQVHAYLSTPSGESLAVLELEFDSSPLVKGAVSHWKQQKVYVEKWNKAQFIEFTKPLIEQGQINSNKKYQGGLDAPEQLVLQMVPFKQGMLYVGSDDALTNDHISIVESLTTVFSIAYTRYEDFKELEAAKSSVENTLSELKSTQTQLIQSEKMASLGELTAGIAHEIQNPLNFVNNFSELSEEMLEELAEEIKDNPDEIVTEIMTDLKQNLNKITNHGKRASSIVKGMLEHSRTSSGVKEPTDINALADEFLRLSYHGLRAKDKTFNAAFKTDFDTSLPKINVIAQDLGRVILNLINNAFYACAERSRSTSERSRSTSERSRSTSERSRSTSERSRSTSNKDYKPTVTVSTKKTGDKIEIRVKDNGSGIPDKIKDKIFQPFFTTKPTGSGTGLGLSMSYDIITKGHGGELKVTTNEAGPPADQAGTEFTIYLPLEKNA